MKKDDVRKAVFERLRRGIALPDSRFHMRLSEFIPDFVGSKQALKRLVEHETWNEASFVFITPDNCLEALRLQAFQEGKIVLVSTYGIKRGFVLLNSQRIPLDRRLYAASLDGMEREGISVSLSEIQSLGKKLDLLVTGTSAVTKSGLRVGKGHGYFDLEWAMFFATGIVNVQTSVAAVVHDCQVVDDEFTPDSFDTVCDWIFTPTREIVVSNPHKPTIGVVWEQLRPGMLRAIPPLRELRMLQKGE